MLKLTGAILLTGTGLCFGLIKGEELKRRERMLAALIRLITRMGTRLRYTAAPLADILSHAAEEGGYAPLELPCFSTATPFPACWNVLIEKTGLPQEDRQLLRSFGEEMGRTDLTGQLAHIEMYGALLEEQRRHAAEEYRKKGRLPAVLWTAGAAAAALLLL